MRTPQSWIAVLIFLLIPAIPLWKVILHGEAIGPFDQIRQMAPWNEPAPNQPWDVLQADAVLQFYPWRAMVFDAWNKGQLPLWNPHQLGGTPLLANSQSGAFYPPHIAVGVLGVEPSVGIGLLAWLHLSWAGLGIFVLTRRLGANCRGSVLAGVLFVLSAFMVSWTALPSVITTVAWIPWALACIMALDSGRRPRTIALLGFSVGMMLLAGHLQFAAYGILAIVVAAVAKLGFDTASSSRFSTACGIFAAVLLGAAMAAPQVLPVLENAGESHRRGSPSEEGYSAYSRSALQPWELLTLSGTNLLGIPTEYAAAGDKLPSYFPPFLKRGANFAESAIGIGPLALGLLLFIPWSFFEWRKSLGIALIGVLGMLLATGSYLGRLFYFYAPGWSSTGSPGRAEVLFVLAATVLAGVVASAPSRKRSAIWEILPYAVLILAVLIAPAIVRVLPATGSDSDGNWLRPLVSTVVFQMLPIALLATVLAGVALYLWRRASRLGEVALIIAAVVGLSALHASKIVPTSAKPLPFNSADPNERYAFVNEAWDIVTAPRAILPPNTSSATGFNSIGGYDSLIDSETVEILRTIDGSDPAPPANGNMMFIKPSFDPVKLSEAGVSKIWSQHALPQMSSTPLSMGTLFEYPLETSGRSFTPQGRAEIIIDGYDRQTIRAVGPGILTVRDRNRAGWQAVSGAKSSYLGDGVWRQVEIAKGTHTVEFRYWPPGLTLGLIIGAVGWLSFVALLVVTRRRVRIAQTPIGIAVE